MLAARTIIKISSLVKKVDLETVTILESVGNLFNKRQGQLESNSCNLRDKVLKILKVALVNLSEEARRMAARSRTKAKFFITH